MHLLIQKFGGTSVQTKENRDHVIRHIKGALDRQYKLIVVVSAIERSPDPYATDSLVKMVDNEVTNDNTKREIHMIMSCGETIASVVISNELQQNEINATTLSGSKSGLNTNDEYNEAKIKHEKPERIK